MCFYSIPTVVRLWWCVMILFFPLSGSLSLPFPLQQLTRLFSASVRSVMPFPSTVIGADGTMGIGPPSSNHPWEWLDNENWDGRELLFSSLIANGTTTSASSSTVRYLSSPTRNRQHTYANDKHTYKDNFDSDDKSLGSRMFSAEALQRWWTRHTAGHRGLLIFLIPSLLRSVTDSLSVCLSVCMRCFSNYSLVLSSLRRFLDDLLFVQSSVGAAGSGALLSGPSVTVPLAHVHRCLVVTTTKDGSCTGADGIVRKHLCGWVFYARRHLQCGVQLAAAQGRERQLRHGHWSQVLTNNIVWFK